MHTVLKLRVCSVWSKYPQKLLFGLVSLTFCLFAYLFILLVFFLFRGFIIGYTHKFLDAYISSRLLAVLGE